MALTDLEKAQNKAARLVRDRAHRARVVLLRQAVEKAENGPEVIQAKEAFEQAARAGQEVKVLFSSNPYFHHIIA